MPCYKLLRPVFTCTVQSSVNQLLINCQRIYIQAILKANNDNIIYLIYRNVRFAITFWTKMDISCHVDNLNSGDSSWFGASIFAFFYYVFRIQKGYSCFIRLLAFLIIHIYVKAIGCTCKFHFHAKLHFSFRAICFSAKLLQ